MQGTTPIKGLGTLTPLQEEFIKVFASLPDKEQFYMAGGTALAEYYLGHRHSFDMDFFTGVENIILPTSYQSRCGLPPAPSMDENGLHISIIGYTPV
jgi:hypothetical protein